MRQSVSPGCTAYVVVVGADGATGCVAVIAAPGAPTTGVLAPALAVRLSGPPRAVRASTPNAMRAARRSMTEAP